MSILKKVSNAAMRSSRIMPQHDCKNRVMKPSGPDTLSGGKDLITTRISALVKCSSRSAKIEVREVYCIHTDGVLALRQNAKNLIEEVEGYLGLPILIHQDEAIVYQ
jgi:hypothetical protein